MAGAIDKYICPFCGQRTLFVGVHDDEGNYKGRPGCEYESDPWSGLCYAIHHDGWGDCILCTGAHDLPLGGCFFDTAEEAFQAIPALTPPNEPLTCQGCACEEYSRDAYPCNSCSRNDETLSDQYRPPEGEEET